MRKKTKAIFISSPIVILIIVYYVFFMRVDEYTYNTVTEILQKDGVEYVQSNSLPSSFLDEREKTIGKIKGSDSESAEVWITKIKIVDEHVMFLVTGLMNEELFVRKDKIDEFNKTLRH